jgi:hypothetical protein
LLYVVEHDIIFDRVNIIVVLSNMKKANKSPKSSKDDSILALTEKQKAQIVLNLANEQQTSREKNPNLTAHIIRADNKTARLHWIKTDELNKEIGL